MNTDSAVLAAMPQLSARYRAGEFMPAQYAASYVLRWQCARHGDRLAQRRSRRDPKPDPAALLARIEAAPADARTAVLVEFLERYDLRTVRRRVNLALCAWLKGEWALTLCDSVPDTRAVLRMQVRGTRPVTVIAAYPRLLDPVREKADGFAFIQHDLEHAWQFFHDPERHDAQRRFAQQLDRALDAGVFAPYAADADFGEKLDYLAADMNTHVMHSLQYLRAILLEFHQRAEGKGPRAALSAEAHALIRRCLANFDGAGAVPESAPVAPVFPAPAKISTYGLAESTKTD